MEGMGKGDANEKQDISVSTAEKGLQISKCPP